MNICKKCGNSFIQNNKYKHKKYCSKKCRYSDRDLSLLINSKNRGLKRTEETKLKLSESIRNGYKTGARIHPSKTNPEWKEKLRIGKLKSSWVMPESQRRAHSLKLKGRIAPVEEVFKRREKLIGRPQKSELTKKGETNIHSKEWGFRDACGVVFKFKNLQTFIETHQNLFITEDLIEKEYCKSCNKNDMKRTYKYPCNAYKRLCEVSNGLKGSWKGWTAYSVLEEKLNNGEDLLQREVKQ